jgi:hypothetical protein
MDLDSLTNTEFEEFCYDLLAELGFVNLDWRKGTGLSSSPSDRGRDIVAQLERVEIDGTKHLETWFVDCKHYKRGVPPEKIQGLLTWAEAQTPDYALVIASNFLSNGAKDFLTEYERNRHPPFRIRYWEKPALERLTEARDQLLGKYLLDQAEIRTMNEIVEAEQEFYERIWYGRSDLSGLSGDLRKRVEAIHQEMEARYGGRDELLPKDDWEWAFWNGKLSALRWVLGDEWDFLDT